MYHDNFGMYGYVGEEVTDCLICPYVVTRDGMTEGQYMINFPAVRISLSDRNESLYNLLEKENLLSEINNNVFTGHANPWEGLASVNEEELNTIIANLTIAYYAPSDPVFVSEER